MKTVDLLYDEFVYSSNPEEMLSKLKTAELIELLKYAHEDCSKMDDYAMLEEENNELKDELEGIKEDMINVNQLKQWMETRTNEVIIELLPKLFSQFTREMNQSHLEAVKKGWC